MSSAHALTSAWLARIAPLHHAFQPIVDIRSGQCFGYEALLRGSEAAGFAAIHDVFDRAFEDGLLAPLETVLWTKAIAKFAEIRRRGSAYLFCNVDNRGAFSSPAHRAALIRSLADFGLPPEALYLEISERHRLGAHVAPPLLSALSQDGLHIALDDLGSGFADLDLLCNWPSDLVKIDRSLVTGIDRSTPHRVMARAMIALAHRFGRHVVAEGIETAEELQVCRELGCDFAQGYFIQRPTTAVDDLPSVYDHVPAPRIAGHLDPSEMLSFAAA